MKVNKKILTLCGVVALIGAGRVGVVALQNESIPRAQCLADEEKIEVYQHKKQKQYSTDTLSEESYQEQENKTTEKTNEISKKTEDVERGTLMSDKKEFSKKNIDELLESRKPSSTNIRLEDKKELLYEAEAFCKLLKDNLPQELKDSDIYLNFIQNYEEFKKDKSEKNFIELQENLQSIEITCKNLGYIY